MAPTGEHGAIELQIEEWVRREVAYPDLKLHGKCSKVALRHLNLTNQIQGDVATFPVKLEDGAENEIAPLLLQIAEASQRDSNDQNSGVQKYALYAYFPADKTYVPRKIFRVGPVDEEVERDVVPSEPPTEKGLVAQTMRHLEAVMRHSTVAQGYQMQVMQRELQRVSDMNERFSQQQIDFLVLFQDTMNDATKRRLAERKEEAGIAMKETALSKLSALLPVIVNRIAGQQVLPQEDTSFMLMSSLLEGLSDDQQKILFNTLSDAQRMTLAEILSQYEKKKDKWLQGQKSMVLGKRNELPPPASESHTDPSVQDVTSVPVPTAMTLHEQMTGPAEKSRDPVLQQYEDDALNFTSRFRDFLKPPTKPQGDK
jgi:hypothetical protein